LARACRVPPLSTVRASCAARAAAIVVTSRAHLDASEALIRWKKKAVVVGLGTTNTANRP
jgi:hypothetical protein